MSDLNQPKRTATTSHEARANELFRQGQTAQQQGNLSLAQRLYEQLILVAPHHARAAYLLGMIHYQGGDLHKATSLILRALDLTAWQPPLFRQNLGLALSRLAAQRAGLYASNALSEKGHRYRAHLEERAALLDEQNSSKDSPLVSVVVLSRNHARYMRSTLESIYVQSYRHIEIVVIDDGSTDNSCDAAMSCLRDCPFAQQLLIRSHSGSQISLNEAISLANGRYINPIDVGDQFAPHRIEHLVKAADAFSSQLVFSNVHYLTIDQCPADPFADARVYSLLSKQANIAYCETVGHAFLIDDVAITAGNLFFSRALFNALNGFRAFRHRHVWDFCLRALWLTEPRHVPTTLQYNLLDVTHTSAEVTAEIEAESIKIYTDYFARAFDSEQYGQEFTPSICQWGDRFTVEALRSGFAPVLPVAFLKAYADQQLRSTTVSTRQSAI